MVWQYNKTADKNWKCYNQEKQAKDQLKSEHQLDKSRPFIVFVLTTLKKDQHG